MGLARWTTTQTPHGKRAPALLQNNAAFPRGGVEGAGHTRGVCTVCAPMACTNVQGSGLLADLRAQACGWPERSIAIVGSIAPCVTSDQHRLGLAALAQPWCLLLRGRRTDAWYSFGARQVRKRARAWSSAITHTAHTHTHILSRGRSAHVCNTLHQGISHLPTRCGLATCHCLTRPRGSRRAEPRLHAHPCHLTSPPTDFTAPPCSVCPCCHANARCLLGWQSFAKMYNNTPGMHVHSKHVPNYFEELSKSKFW